MYRAHSITASIKFSSFSYIAQNLTACRICLGHSIPSILILIHSKGNILTQKVYFVIWNIILVCIWCHLIERGSLPDSKWKLDQRWALSFNFCWANVGCAMQNHRHFAHPKNVGPTCCTNVGRTCSRNVGPTSCINVGPTCWANVGSLLASGSC